MPFLNSDISRPVHGLDAVTFNDTAVMRIGRDGETDTLYWVDLDEVAIVTRDTGPVHEDLYWELCDQHGAVCAISGRASGSGALLARLQELPGFDNEAVIAAMASTRNAKFVCWRRLAR